MDGFAFANRQPQPNADGTKGYGPQVGWPNSNPYEV